MSRAAAALVTLAMVVTACSVADDPARATSPTRRTVLLSRMESLKMAGSAGEDVIQELPVPIISVGNAAPMTAPIAQTNGAPSAEGSASPEPSASALPTKVPWSDPGTAEEDSDEPTGPRPQRIELPQRVVTFADPSTLPRRLGGNPCCGMPCGVNARSLAALMANPAMTAHPSGDVTTIAGRASIPTPSRSAMASAIGSPRFAGFGGVRSTGSRSR